MQTILRLALQFLKIIGEKIVNLGEAGDLETKLIPKTILLTVQHPLINCIDTKMSAHLEEKSRQSLEAEARVTTQLNMYSIGIKLNNERNVLLF